VLYVTWHTRTLSLSLSLSHTHIHTHMTRFAHIWLDAFLCGAIHSCDISTCDVTHTLSLSLTTHTHTHTYIHDVIRSHRTRRICAWMNRDMGWLQLVGSLKLQFSFAEYSFFYRALLQKRPIILRSLLIVATPYHGRIVMWGGYD